MLFCSKNEDLSDVPVVEVEAILTQEIISALTHDEAVNEIWSSFYDKNRVEFACHPERPTMRVPKKLIMARSSTMTAQTIGLSS